MPDTLATAIPLCCVALWLARMAYHHALTWRFFARPEPPGQPEVPPVGVSIIVPVRGVEACSEAAFAAACSQDYAGPWETVFCVEEIDDPAVPVIERVLSACPEARARLVLSGDAASDALGKVRNLAAGLAVSRHPVVAFVDSDVLLPPTFLRDTAPAVGDPAVGLAFAAPAAEGAEDWVAALHNAAVNETVVQVAPLAYHGRTGSALGATMVVRREVLDEIGGLEPYGRHIGDDVAIGSAIRSRGYALRLLPRPARMVHPEDSLRRWWWQTHRWMVTIRSYYPHLVVPVLVGGFPMVWGPLYLLACLREGYSPLPAVVLLAVCAAVLVGSSLVINARWVKDPGWWRWAWVVPLLDWLRLAVLVHASVTRTVVWRGRRWRVGRDHKVTPVE